MGNNQLLSATHSFVLPSDRLKTNGHKSGVFWLTGLLGQVSRTWPMQSISHFVGIALLTFLFSFIFNVEAQEVNTKKNDTVKLDTNNMTANQIAQKLTNTFYGICI